MDTVTVIKMRGRPRKEIKLDTSAEKQRSARGKAHSAFLNEPNIENMKKLASDMSTSNLISLLPRLMSKEMRVAVETVRVEVVCAELIRRAKDNKSYSKV